MEEYKIVLISEALPSAKDESSAKRGVEKLMNYARQTRLFLRRRSLEVEAGMAYTFSSFLFFARRAWSVHV